MQTMSLPLWRTNTLQNETTSDAYAIIFCLVALFSGAFCFTPTSKLAARTMMPISAGMRNRQLPQLTNATMVLKIGKAQKNARFEAAYQCLRSATAPAATNNSSGKVPSTVWESPFQNG